MPTRPYRWKYCPSRRRMEDAKDDDHNVLALYLLINYGGRVDILQAIQKLAQYIVLGELYPRIEASKRLCTSHLPDTDLIIRMGGEKRPSICCFWTQQTHNCISVMFCYHISIRALWRKHCYGIRNERRGLAGEMTNRFNVATIGRWIKRSCKIRMHVQYTQSLHIGMTSSK